MPRALFVIYDFPPATSSGVFRPLRLLKHLPEHGWDATVITTRVGRGRRTDAALLERVPRSVQVVRTRSPEPRVIQLALMRAGLRGPSRWIDRWSRVPDAQRMWVGHATRAAVEAAAAEPHDLLWTTSAPYSAHLAGLRIKQATGLPWIADFRDEWTHPDLMAALPTERHRALHRRQEAGVLGAADRVVGVSDAFVDDLIRTCGRERGDFAVIPNGFDEADFAGPAPVPSRDRFVVAYTGLVYGRGPLRTFLTGVRKALERGPIPAERLRLEFVGHGNEALAEAGALPEGVLSTRGQVPHDQAMNGLRGASLLLLLADPERGPGLFPGKIFPYLASKRPVLALIRPDAAAAELLRQGGNAAIVPPDDADGVAEALVRGFQAWERGENPAETNPAVVARFSSRTQTSQWVELFDQVRSSCASRSA